jgi:MYXO-CTERM domain-containing protein
VAVQNASAATWSITSVVSDNPELVIDTTGFPSSLAAGQTASLSVSFHPVAAGVRTGLLKISFSGSTSPTTVSLSGTGVEDHPPGGCGCGATGAGTPAMALLALAGLLRRRAPR